MSPRKDDTNGHRPDRLPDIGPMWRGRHVAPMPISRKLLSLIVTFLTITAIVVMVFLYV